MGLNTYDLVVPLKIYDFVVFAVFDEAVPGFNGLLVGVWIGV